MQPSRKRKERRTPKKKNSFKRKRGWDFSNGITINDLENINNALHAHKSQVAGGKGSFKLVPKDSCEVYKERRKRQAKNRNTEEENQKNSNKQVNTRNNKETKGAPRNPCQCHKRRHRRRRADSYSSPDTSSTTTESSNSSTSEMDYE